MKAAQDWPVFVISLTDAGERRARISEQLSALSIPFEFVDAIDGRSGLPAEYERMIDRAGTLVQERRGMSDAEYACALSHMSVYKRILDQNLPGAIVLEDDAILGAGFAAYRGARAYEHGDLIQLDYTDARIWRFAKAAKQFPDFALMPIVKIGILANGYSVSLRGARHLYTHGLPIRHPADWPCDVSAINCLISIPRIVDHPPIEVAQSTLEMGRRLLLSVSYERKSSRFTKAKYWRRKWSELWTKRAP
ncbi:MAG: glycosyltransferase family 25 protein [Roseinatronobacter sp.]|nr:glycosyltransferase family 25 protein [Roseinatronobacter sp.]